ncbi:MAG: hypothetical protein EOP84_16350, partial [Verrucomicrobiaceae bacterium]
MRFIEATAVVMFVSFQVLHATIYAPPTRIHVSAANSDYILELIPGDREGRFSPEDSKVICYQSLLSGNTRTFERKLWETTGWYSWGCILSDDGRRVAQIGQASTMSGGISILRCIRFWQDGELKASFTCYDLVPNLDEFGAAGPFVGGDWICYNSDDISPNFLENDKFRFSTIDGKIHVFDFKTSKMESRVEQAGNGQPAS